MLKKGTSFFLIILIIISGLTLSSCSKDEFKDAYALVYLDHVAYLLNKENELKSLKAYEALPTIFDNLMVVGRYVNQRLKYGYIDRNGDEVIKCQYDMAYPFGEGKAVVKKGDVYKIIDQNNKVLYTFPKGIASYDYFNEGFLKIETPDGFSFINKDYQILDKSYYQVLSYHEGLALVINNDENKSLSFLDTNYQEVLTDVLTNFDYAESFSNGLALVRARDSHLYSFLKKDGTLLIDENGNSTFQDARSFSEKRAVVFTGEIYYTLYSPTAMPVAAYYSYQYLNNDGTYYEYYYKDFHHEEKQNVLLWGYLNNCYGSAILTKEFTTGAGKWKLYHDSIYQRGQDYIPISYMDGVVADYDEIVPTGIKDTDSLGIEAIDVTAAGDVNVILITYLSHKTGIIKAPKGLKIASIHYEYQENEEFMNLYFTYSDGTTSEAVKVCNHYFEEITYTFDFDDLTKLEEHYYSMPYDINFVNKSTFYTDQEITLIGVRVSTDKVAIIDENGKYLTKAIFDSVLF